MTQYYDYNISMRDEGVRTLNDRRDELTDDLKAAWKQNEDNLV
jgi:hypothetical protein